MCTLLGVNERVAVREFRQNLRAYLDAAADGRSVLVERDGRPVAVLGPVDASTAVPPQPSSASNAPARVVVDKAAIRETFEDLGERLGGRFRLVSEPIGDTSVQSEGTHRRLAARTAQRVARDLDMPVPRVAWFEQEARSTDFEPLAGFAVPHLHAIALDRHVGELDFDDRKAGDFDVGVRQLRHTVAHECFHLFDASASEAECDAFADHYSGGTWPAAGFSRSGPACDQFVSWWGGRGWRGPQIDPTFGL